MDLPRNGGNLHYTHGQEKKRGTSDVATELRIGLAAVFRFLLSILEPQQGRVQLVPTPPLPKEGS